MLIDRTARQARVPSLEIAPVPARWLCPPDVS
ncbi:hypothetical protein J2W56_006840 [Nocardia kruczakiae]|uniref:Uncharacterized protein n=1 Tax=Nocardia kruczakiae TaxID=261477 RepID=A0ABU1XRR4_9NOCA|nr:hypothetical protein [Nocardia kruczakiae]